MITKELKLNTFVIFPHQPFKKSFTLCGEKKQLISLLKILLLYFLTQVNEMRNTAKIPL